MKHLCIIPARRGSKRLPDKNFIPFFGKAMFAYTLEAAIKSGVFEKIVLSSNEPSIIDEFVPPNLVGKFDFMLRSEELSSDKATMWDVLNHVLDVVGDDYDYVFAMLPTSPLRDETHVQNVAKMVESERCNAVVAVTDFFFHIDYAFQFAKDNKSIERVWPESSDKKSQEFSHKFVDNGSVYAMKPEFYRKNLVFPENTLPYFMPLWQSIDVDTKEDLEIAKALYEYFQLKKA